MSVEWESGLTYEIGPLEILTYTFNFTDCFASPAVVSSYTIYPSDGVTLIEDAREDGFISVSVSGVAVGHKESIGCRVTSDEAIPQTAYRSFYLTGVNK